MRRGPGRRFFPHFVEPLRPARATYSRGTFATESDRLNRDLLVGLVRSHQAQIYRYLRYLGAQRDVAEDLTQETFVVAFQKSTQGHWSETANPAAWLRGVSRNLFLAHCRRAKSNPVLLDTEYVEQAEAWWAQEFAGSADGSAHLSALRLCLQALPQRERQMVELQYGLRKSRAQIAAAHGLTEDGVKTLMRHIRASLALCIQRRLKSQGEPCR
jgi:RNA polymerase sigma-70 factor (ECF subfamily)